MLRHLRQVDFKGLKLKVVSPEDLVVMKAIARVISHLYDSIYEAARC